MQTFVFVFSNNTERKISAENLEKAIKIAEKIAEKCDLSVVDYYQYN